MLRLGAAAAAVLVLVAVAGSGADRAETKPEFSVFMPPDPVPANPAVIAVHGGSWQHGDGGKMRRVGEEIAAAGFVVFHVKYTYATETRAGYPRQVDDIRNAIGYIRRNAGDYGIDPRRIGAIGSSSGAHLVGLLATQGRGPLDEGGRVGAAVTWSAPFDLRRLRKHNFSPGVRKFLGCYPDWCRRKAWRGSPLKYVSSDDPPMQMAHGRGEIFPLRPARRMARKLRRAGVPRRLRILGGGRHGMNYADVMTKEAIAFFREQLAE
jgi:acetyl esterase/lipase